MRGNAIVDTSQVLRRPLKKGKKEDYWSDSSARFPALCIAFDAGLNMGARYYNVDLTFHRRRYHRTNPKILQHIPGGASAKTIGTESMDVIAGL